MGYDGYLKFSTKLDNSEFESGMKKLSSVAKAGAVAVSAAVGVSIGAAIKVGSQFESSMSQVASTMGMTVEQINSGDKSFQALEQAAKDAGVATKFSASQAGEALNYLALAGYDAEKSVKALPDVLNLAAAGGLELGYASDLVTDSMSALGTETDQLTSFTDQLAKASQKSNTNVGQLGEAILAVGGTAKDLAGGTVELNTALGILADNGIKGAEGGTALRNIMLAMTPTTDKARGAFKRLSLESYDANGNLRPLNETFRDLNEKLSSMSSEGKTQVLDEIFNKVDLKSVNALLANSGERFDELSTYIANADGAAANMAETMNDNLKGQVTILGSSLEGTGIQIYEKFEGPLKRAAKVAIQSVSDIGSSLKDGKLSESMDSLAESTGNFMEEVARLSAKGLPKLIDGLAFITSHGKETVAMLVSAKIAMVGFKNIAVIDGVMNSWKAATITVRGYSGAMLANNAVSVTGRSVNILLASTMSAQELIVGILTGKVALATAAQAAWNTVMMANPIGAVVVVVAALVAGLAILSVATKKESDEQIELNKKMGESEASLKSHLKSKEEMKKTRQDGIDMSMSEIDYAQKQIDKMDEFVDANGRVKEGYEARARALEEQVNAIIPNAIELSEEEGAMYLTVADNLDLLMEKKKINALLDAYHEEYVEALKNQSKAIEEMSAAQDVLEGKKRLLIQAEQELQQAMETGRDSAVRVAEEKVAALQGEVDASQTIYDKNGEIAKGYFDTIDRQNKLEILSHSDKVDEMKQGMKDLEYNLKEYTGTNSTEMKKQLQDTTAAYAQHLSLAKQYNGDITETQLAALLDAKANADQTVAEYAKTGEEIPLQIKNGMQKNEKQVPEIVGLLVSAGIIKAEESEKLFAGVGENYALGFANSLGSKSMIDLVTNRAGALAFASLTGLKTPLKIQSPSRSTYKIGDYFVQGFTNAVNDKKSKAQKAVEDMSKSILSSASEVVSEQRFYNKMSTAQEVSFWEGMFQIAELKSEEIKKVEKNLYLARQKMAKESYSNSKIWIEDRKYYNKLSLSEELQAWQRVQDRYLAGTDERMEADKKVYEVKGKIVKEMESLEKGYTETLKKRSSELFKSFNLFDEVKKDNEVSGKQLLSNLEEQISTMESFYADLDKLTQKGVSDDLVESIRDMGVGASDELKALIRLSDSDLEKYSNLFGEKQKLANDLATAELENLKIETDTKVSELLEGVEEQFDRSPAIGLDMSNGIANGILSGMSNVIHAAIKVAQAAIRAAKRELDINSPSKVMRDQVGRMIPKGIAIGMEAEIPAVEKAMSTDMEALVRKMRSAVEMENQRVVDQVKPSVINMFQTSVQQGDSDKNPTKEGDFIVNIEKVENANGRTIEDFCTEVEFYRRRKSTATGGIA